jgi:hypothetical protein
MARFFLARRHRRDRCRAAWAAARLEQRRWDRPAGLAEAEIGGRGYRVLMAVLEAVAAAVWAAARAMPESALRLLQRG